MERFEEQWGIFSENARQAPPLPMVGFAWFAVRKKWEGGGGCDRQTDGQTDGRTDNKTRAVARGTSGPLFFYSFEWLSVSSKMIVRQYENVWTNTLQVIYKKRVLRSMVRIEGPKLILIERASNHLSVRIDGFYRIGLHKKLWTIYIKSKIEFY